MTVGAQPIETGVRSDMVATRGGWCAAWLRVAGELVQCEALTDHDGPHRAEGRYEWGPVWADLVDPELGCC